MTNNQKTGLDQTVAILGASPNTERYAWKAQQLLTENHYLVVPVSAKKYAAVEGLTTFHSLTEIPGSIHTVTVYLNPNNLKEYVDQIIAVKPARVILNPGSEDSAVIAKLRKAGIDVELACTLVLLRTGQF